MKYACFLRGISPLNAPSAKLREVFTSLGFTNVQTILSSGNVVFESDATHTSDIEERITTALHKALGITSAAIIRSAEQISALVAAKPFGARTHSRESYLTATFFKTAPKEAPRADAPFIAYDATNLALLATNDAARADIPEFMASLEKTFGKAITTRTWNTVLRVHQKMQ